MDVAQFIKIVLEDAKIAHKSFNLMIAFFLRKIVTGKFCLITLSTPLYFLGYATPQLQINILKQIL